MKTPTTEAKKTFADWKPEAQAAITWLISVVEKSRLTQEQHAFAGGFNSRTFRRWLKKESEPDGEYLKALLRYLAKK